MFGFRKWQKIEPGLECCNWDSLPDELKQQIPQEDSSEIEIDNYYYTFHQKDGTVLRRSQEWVEARKKEKRHETNVNATACLCTYNEGRKTHTCSNCLAKEMEYRKAIEKPMKPMDFTVYGREREEGEKLVCSVCKMRFQTLEEYRKHHWETCSGRGS